jgi:Na+/proline symporter
MDDESDKSRRRALRIRALSFPVCTVGSTAVGGLIGLARRSGNDIFPLYLIFALIGLVVGVVMSAIVASAIDWKYPRR